MPHIPQLPLPASHSQGHSQGHPSSVGNAQGHPHAQPVSGGVTQGYSQNSSGGAQAHSPNNDADEYDSAAGANRRLPPVWMEEDIVGDGNDANNDRKGDRNNDRKGSSSAYAAGEASSLQGPQRLSPAELVLQHKEQLRK